MDQKLADRLARCPILPTLPGVAIEVVRICGREDEVDLDELAAAIERDPALVTKVLRVVNSAVYRLREPLTSLRHALTLMGVPAVRAIALSFSLTTGIQEESRGLDLRRYWRRSLYAAIAAQELAKAAGLPLAEEAFLAGLMQDVGMVALARLEPGGYAEIVAARPAGHDEVAATERRAFGADHVEVGEWLLAQWGIPALLRDAVRGSHATRRNPEGSLLCEIVAASGPIGDIWVESLASAATQARDRARDLLGLDDETFEDVLDRVAAGIANASTVFDVDLDSPDEVAAVLEEAKEALVAASLRVARTAHDLREQADLDALTKLPNRTRLDAMLAALFGDRDQQPLSVLVCDVDHFKIVNDTYGHLAGDRVLVSVAGRLRGGLRDTDLVVRYGGEEFVVVLPGALGPAARAVAERLRAAVGDTLHDAGEGHVIPVTISIGCATHAPASRFPTPAALLESADRALYAAKSSGRNRVVADGDHEDGSPSRHVSSDPSRG
jgi:diguanylate cyclase (GGDEF)-like protein